MPAPSASSFHLVLVLFGCAISVHALGMLLSWGSRACWTGSLLATATKPRSVARIYTYVVFVALWLTAVVVNPAHYLFCFTALMVLTSGSALLVGGVLEIREKGLFVDGFLISWNRIDTCSWTTYRAGPAYQWSGAVEPEEFTLSIRLSRPMFFRRALQLSVPDACVDAFARALTDHLHPASRS